MWLFTKRGFYSIVEDSLKIGSWQVRARVKVDLENLIQVIGYGGQLITTPRADYRYRIVIDAHQLIKIMTTMAKDINYTNFKNECAKRVDQDHNYDALHEIWGVMYSVQFANLPKVSGKRKKSKGKEVKTKYGKTVYTNF